MAKRQVTNINPRWPTVTSAADLPNVAGSPTQSSYVEVGDTCYVSGTALSLYVCTSAGVGTATWILGGVPAATTTAAGLMSAADKVLVNLLNSGSGSPESVVTATVGDVYMDTTNGKLYLKVSGTGNTGWREVSPSVSGTYTPSGTAVTNLDSVTALSATYIRVGDIVIVDGIATIDPTASGVVTFGVSLPIASALAATSDLFGIASQASPFPGVVAADTTNDRASVTVNNTSTSASSAYYHFAYRVLP